MMLTCYLIKYPEKLWLQHLFLGCDRVIGNLAKSVCLPYGDKINSLDYSLSTFLP